LALAANAVQLACDASRSAALTVAQRVLGRQSRYRFTHAACALLRPLTRELAATLERVQHGTADVVSVTH
jgi:hypothetical protein